MGKRSSRELVGDIAEALTDDPQSIQEISDKVGADRQSVTKYLEELRDAGIVKEEKSGRTREFFVSEYEDKEAYFELPLKNDEKDKLRFLFKKILDRYQDKFDKIPGKLMYQKIAVEVIDGLDLQLPHGRYQYGSITAMNFTPGDGNGVGPVDLGPDFDEEEVDEAVEETVEEYGELGFHEARQKQYEDKNMELYLKKEDIMEALAGEIKDTDKFQRMLYTFLAKTPDLEDEHEEAMVEFIAVAPDLLEKRLHRSKVMETFKEFWELIAFYCFREDMEEYYDKEIVEQRTEKELEEKWDEVEQALTELVSLHNDVIETEIDDELSELRGSAEEISEEEKQKREEELGDMDSSDLAREFGLDS